MRWPGKSPVPVEFVPDTVGDGGLCGMRGTIPNGRWKRDRTDHGSYRRSFLAREKSKAIELLGNLATMSFVVVEDPRTIFKS